VPQEAEGTVDRVRLRQYLPSDLVVVEVVVLRGVGVHLRAIDRGTATPTRPASGAKRQHLTEQTGQRRLVALAKARDRAVIGPLVRGDHTERNILHAAPLDTRDDRRPTAYA